MELPTPPPAARAPVAWYSWWLMPLALGAGTVTAAVAGPDQTQIPATFAGAAATAASAVCVRLLVRAQLQLRRNAGDFRSSQADLTQQWEQHVAGLERKFTAERSVQEAQLDEQLHAYEARFADSAHAQEARVARLTEAYEARIAAQTEASEAALAARTEVWQDQLAAQRAAVALLADEQLPEALERLRAGDAIDDLLPSVTRCAEVGPELQAELRKVLRTALIGVEREFDRSTSAEQAVISIGSRIHVLTSKLRGRLHEMQGEHGRLPVVARGLMELDQEIGPADRLAASIGVLGGSDRPGRQWQEPQRLLSVVRGGIGRIKDFDRVEVRHLPELGVDGGLVDHLTLVFAHLLDNAARYSPPTEAVVVSGKEVPNGVGIEIQDAGKGLSEEKKREAEQSLAGTAAGPGIGGLSEDASLGLRVVGALARRYGIRVTFADSPWLGTSVVVVVPHKYFSPLPAAVAEPATPLAPSAPAAPDETAEAEDTTPGGLPRRRSRRSDQQAPSARPKPTERPDEAVAAVPPDASFTGLAAFATAGRETDPPRAAVADHGPVGPGETPADRASAAAAAGTTADRGSAETSDTTAARDLPPAGETIGARGPVALGEMPAEGDPAMAGEASADHRPTEAGEGTTDGGRVEGAEVPTDGGPVDVGAGATGPGPVGGVEVTTDRGPVGGAEEITDGGPVDVGAGTTGPGPVGGAEVTTDRGPVDGAEEITDGGPVEDGAGATGPGPVGGVEVTTDRGPVEGAEETTNGGPVDAGAGTTTPGPFGDAEGTTDRAPVGGAEEATDRGPGEAGEGPRPPAPSEVPR